MLKRTIKLVLTVLIVFTLVYAFNIAYKNKDRFLNSELIKKLQGRVDEISGKKVCSGVVDYSLGSVDKNFGLSNEQFLNAIKEAESIWEKGAGRNLFVYSKTGGLKVNLVFDQRQEDTTRMKEILSGITSDEDKLKAVKTEYDKLAAAVKLKEASFNSNWEAYQKSQAVFEDLVKVYNAKVSAYEQQVAFWSSKGGAPKKEYDELNQEKADIQTMYEELNSQREALKKALLLLEAQRNEFNSLVSQVNTIAGIFNRLAEKLNVRVTSYNEVQGARDEFISGLYTSDATGRTIDIFQFYDNKDLVTTIAHELGHALGLGHATGTNSIMYPRAEGQKIQLTEEDLQMLKAKCNY